MHRYLTSSMVMHAWQFPQATYLLSVQKVEYERPLGLGGLKDPGEEFERPRGGVWETWVGLSWAMYSYKVTLSTDHELTYVGLRIESCAQEIFHELHLAVETLNKSQRLQHTHTHTHTHTPVWNIAFTNTKPSNFGKRHFKFSCIIRLLGHIVPLSSENCKKLFKIIRELFDTWLFVCRRFSPFGTVKVNQVWKNWSKYLSLLAGLCSPFDVYRQKVLFFQLVY